MLVSENWLRQLANPDLNTDGLTHRLTMAGLEVDSVEPLALLDEKIVVGQVISVTPHTDSKKLKICEVSNGDQSTILICGAENVYAGMKTAFAQVGANLPNGMNIGKIAIKGVESSGMLCSEKELGISDDHSGIMDLGDALVGTPLNSLLELPDTIIDIDLTPNRGDCLSMNGIARELATLTGCELKLEDVAEIPGDPNLSWPVTLEASSLCPRYVGKIIRNFDNNAKTPLWMGQRLNRGGMRSVGNFIVDVTNYVQLEMGQPMHAFDLDKLQGTIRVKQTGESTYFTGVDGSEYQLDPDTLVIADDSGPIAVAGVIGGQSTAVSADTTNILLESAYFTPDAVAGRARKMGLQTDSSHRFERGIDPTAQGIAVAHAAQLILSVAGGEAGITLEQVDQSHINPNPWVFVDHKRVNRLLGISLTTDCIDDIFRKLQFNVTKIKQGWEVTAPSWRSDIQLECDVIEEIIRVHGYENIPTHTAHGQISISVPADTTVPERTIKERLASMGFSEAISYSFVDPELQSALIPNSEAIHIANPLSADISVMRTSLLPGLLTAYLRNIKRQAQNIRLFEIGHVFQESGGQAMESGRLAGIAGGDESAIDWSAQSRKIDFYDLKGYITNILQLTNKYGLFSYEASENPSLHPGQAADVLLNNERIGYLGRLHPNIEKKLDINQPTYVFELELKAVQDRNIACFKALSQYPSSRRDLAIIIDETITSAQIREVILETSGELLTNLELFDVYRGNNIDLGRKSLGFSLTFQGLSRTLKDSEIDDSMNAVISALKSNFEAEIRK